MQKSKEEYRDYHFKKLEDSNHPYPDWWDDTSRRVEGNWKSQYKVNKQHNIHNNGKSDKTIRNIGFDDFSQDEIDEMLYEDFIKNWDQKLGVSKINTPLYLLNQQYTKFRGNINVFN